MRKIRPENFRRQARLLEYPTRVGTSFLGKKGQIVLDQIRTLDKKRLVKVLGKIDTPTSDCVLETLTEMFAP